MAGLAGVDAADDGRRVQPVIAEVPHDFRGMRAGQRGQQPARGLGVAEQELLPFGEARVVFDPFREEAAVGVGAAGCDARLDVILGRRQDRDQVVPDRGRDRAGGRDIPEMSQQAESRDVGHGVGTGRGHDDGGVAIERRHHLERLAHGSPGILAALGGRRDDPQAQRLAQHEEVAGLGPGVGDDGGRMHPADDGEPEDRLLRLDRVSADDRDARLARLVAGPPEDLDEHLGRQGTAGESHDAQRRQGRAGHRVHVAQGVGRRHGAEVIGPVHDRREEVGGQDQRQVVAHLVDRGIVGRRVTDQHVGVVDRRQAGQEREQVVRRLLGRASRPLGELGQPDRIQVGHGRLPRSRIGGAPATIHPTHVGLPSIIPGAGLRGLRHASSRMSSSPIQTGGGPIRQQMFLLLGYQRRRSRFKMGEPRGHQQPSDPAIRRDPLTVRVTMRIPPG